MRYPAPAAGLSATSTGEASIWPALVASCRQAIHAHRSTLLFTNTRRHAEKLARLINEAEGAVLAYAHHGSLSREIRAAVERRLKRGELKAIVATSSLELGIDIGELDQVLLIQTPFSVASTLQRIGRAGHSVREASLGVLHPLHGLDVLEAALMAQAVREQDIEETRPVLCPLDLLAQVILSMTGVERWDLDRLFDQLRCELPLPRAHPPAVRAGAGHAGRALRGFPAPRAGEPRAAGPRGQHRGGPARRPGPRVPLRRDHPGPRLLRPAHGRLPRQDRGAGRGVRLGAPGGGHLHAGHPGLAHPAHRRPQRGGHPVGRGGEHHGVLEGGAGGAGLPLLRARRAGAGALEPAPVRPAAAGGAASASTCWKSRPPRLCWNSSNCSGSSRAPTCRTAITCSWKACATPRRGKTCAG